MKKCFGKDRRCVIVLSLLVELIRNRMWQFFVDRSTCAWIGISMYAVGQAVCRKRRWVCIRQ